MKIKLRVRNAFTKEILGYEFTGANGWWYFETLEGKHQAGTLQNHTDFIREPYVGRRDDLGREIYLNDVVQAVPPHSTTKSTTALVGFDEMNTCYELSEFRDGRFHYDLIPFYEDLKLEIIGDVYSYQTAGEPALG